MKSIGFPKEFEVHYFEVDQHQEATPVTILRYLEETAIAHSEAVGLGIKNLREQGIAWLLNRWSVQMDRYPIWNEKIVVETWPSYFERFYATRQFAIKDKKGALIGKATSLWIFLNIERKRPVRIPNKIMLPYGLNEYTVMDEPFGELYSLPDTETVKEFYVRRSDIDTNKHVNNTRYLDWVLETISDEIYENYSLESFEILYKKEIGFGEMVSARSKILTDITKPVVAHTICNKEQGLDLAQARTSWSKR